jgi:hypothetical protein
MGKKRQGGKANAGVGVDFKRVKHKVGKKLPKAANETRTDFKSRSINLPSQNIAADKDEAVLASRNLTLTVGVSVRRVAGGGLAAAAADAQAHSPTTTNT